MDGLAGGFAALCLVPAKAPQLALLHLLQRVLIRPRKEDAKTEAETQHVGKLGGAQIHLSDLARLGLGKK